MVEEVPVRDDKAFGVGLTAAALWLVMMPAVAGAQYPYPYPYPAYRYAQPDASVRLDVTPKEAEVYVDGYYAGIVDDYNGVFQRLHLPPGEHDITLYRDGYRSATQHVYLTPDNTFKIKYTMETLAPGDVADARPVPANPPPAPAPPPPPGARRRTPPPAGAPYPPYPPYPPQGTPPQGVPPQPYPTPQGVPPPPPPNAPTESGAPSGPTGSGTISIRLQPIDAEVLIDGQPWSGSPGQDRVVIDASEGRHSLQVRKAGFIGFLTEVQVRRGETTTIDVALRPQPK
jgi:hypothetical protein